MKSTILGAAAVALVVGVSAVGGTSIAGPVKLKFSTGCWPGFIASTNTKSCSKTFYATCKKGSTSNVPRLTHLGGKKWRVTWFCVVK